MHIFIFQLKLNLVNDHSCECVWTNGHHMKYERIPHIQTHVVQSSPIFLDVEVCGAFETEPHGLNMRDSDHIL